MVQKPELFDMMVKVTQGLVVDARTLDTVKPALDRGLIRVWEGEALVTEKGKQFMFQWDCEQFLKAVVDSRKPRDSDEVVQWLTQHQFIVKTEQRNWQLTPRGRDWLSQLQ